MPLAAPRRVGWRIWTGGTIGLIGSHGGTVELRLAAPRRVRLGLVPWRARRIVVSVADPDALLSDLAALAGAAAKAVG